MSVQSVEAKENLSGRLSALTKPASDIDVSLLISATYDGDSRLAVLKFYDQKAGRFWLWKDNTGHRPYCFTRLPMEDLAEIRSRKDVVDIVEEERLDLLNDQRVKLRKIITTDPLAIGGGNDSIRDRIKAWEADIKYYENFAYDRGLRMGTYYRVSQGKVVPVKHPVPERVLKSLEEITRRNPQEFGPYLTEWAELLGAPLADFRRVAMDIEVANESGRLPDPEQPDQRIIAVSFFSDSEKVVYLLRNGKEATGLGEAPYPIEVFEDEPTLLRAAMSKMMDYPFLVTFNGDNFDLRYLKHRAEKLGIREEEDPIQLERVAANLKHGVHVDLYQFFRNRSIQVYAFSNRYTEHTLDAIADALLGKSKLEFEGEIGDLPLKELADYCLHDSQLTFELTSMGDSLTMKLLLVIARIGRMPMNDVSRLGVSNWIRSMLFYEHRKIGALIPRQDELVEKGGATSKAIIKGKKYKGGLVIEPKPGVHFDVSVMDFASLYPSLIKVHNLSYETVNCPHEECKKNRIPDTDSWECSRRKGITSLVIGSLRDLRVSHYKVLARDQTLSKTDRELYSVVSQGLKVYLNAAYGSFGFESFAFYCLPVAEATAALGRYAITRTIEKAKELGIEVVYGDTDSTFLRSPSKEQIDTIRKWADTELGVELDLDKVYRYVAFSSRKKNYFGVLPDGTVDIRGLTGKKSVDGATSIIVKIDGRQRFTTVSEAYEEFKSGRHVEVVSIDDRLRTAWTPISDGTRHQVRDAYGVSSSKGREVILSGDHSVYLMDELGNLVTRATRDLRVGDVLVGSRLIPLGSEIPVIAVSDYLASPVMEREGLLHSTRKGSTTGTPIPSKLKLSLELARLLGIYTAEGGSSSNAKQRNNVISQDSLVNGEVCGEIRASWKAVFGWEVHAIRRPGHTQDFYLPVLYGEFFRKACGRNSGGKKVPDFIFGAERSIIREFIRGYFSGDGYSNAKRINATSRSRQLMVQLAYLLAYFDVDCRIRKQYNQKYRRYYYWLSVIGSSSRKRFILEIGFIQKRFGEIPGDRAINKELLPFTTAGILAVKNSMLTRLGKHRVRNVNFHDRRRYNIALIKSYNQVIEKLMRMGDSSDRSSLSKISLMINSQDVTYDEVVSVRKLSGSYVMYDFSVPGIERFVAGNLPTLLHNSQTPEYLKETFYSALDFLSRVQSPEDFQKARDSIRDLLAGMIANLKGKKVPVQKLAFNVMMGKPTEKYNGTTPQHVRAAKLLEEKGREIKAGEMIAYVKTKSPPYVKPVDLARVDDVDSDKYIEYAHSMFDQMLDALDFSFDEIMGATTLDFFWSS